MKCKMTLFLLGKLGRPCGGMHLAMAAPLLAALSWERQRVSSQVHTCGGASPMPQHQCSDECTAANRLLLAVTHPAV